MALRKITFQPGINREGTSYDNELGWFDCNLIRFRMGRPEKFGGWQKLLTSCLLYTSPSPRDLSTSRMPSSA